jgi:hypothetical protein
MPSKCLFYLNQGAAASLAGRQESPSHNKDQLSYAFIQMQEGCIT